MVNQVNASACPFCGAVIGLPHETQESCIAALHAEIDRMREVLEYVKQGPVVGVGSDNPDRR